MEGKPGSTPHRPLREGQIRLAVVHRGKPDDPITCTLMHVVLHPDMPYHALSYVWGDPTITSEITLDNSPYHITINLFNVLRSIRSEEYALYMWIDALCINQSDVDERDREVLRMRDIYQASSKVILWLGPSDPFSPIEVGVAFQSAEYFAELPILAQGTSPVPVEDELIAKKESCMSVLYVLLNRECFERAWIVQEVIVCERLIDSNASSKVVLFCGGKSIPLSVVTKFVDNYIQHNMDEPWRIRVKFTQSSFIKSLREFYMSGIKPENRLPVAWQLLEILSIASGHFEASIPHDRLYSLLGLIHGNIPESLRPDYRKPHNIVFYDYAKYIFQETGNPTPLTSIRHPCPGQPSWVPDFTWGYNLDTYPQPSVQLLPNTKMLQAGGVRLQPVARALDAYQPDSEGDITKYLQTCERFLFQKDVLQRYDSEETILAKWIDLLHGDVYEKDIERHLYLKLLGHQNHKDKTITPTMEAHFSDYLHATFTVSQLFVLEDGTFGSTFLSKGQQPQPGDVAYILKGLSRFILLRTDGEEYRIVGSIGAHSEYGLEKAYGDGAWEVVIIK